MMAKYPINFKLYLEFPADETDVPKIPLGIPLPYVSKKWWSKYLILSKKNAKDLLRKRGRPKKQRENSSSPIPQLPDDWWENDDWVPGITTSYDEPIIKDDNVEVIGNNSIVEEGNVEIRQIGNRKIIKKFECGLCWKKFSASSTLKYHSRKHNSDELLRCNDCGSGFVNKYQLKVHMRKHRGDFFLCRSCGQGFVTAELLKVHTRLHTGEKPFVCDQSGCDRRFATASNLNQHKESHDKSKKFLCLECGADFHQRRCLDAHMLTHSEKMFTCAICRKKWARSQYLKEHMRVHTGEKPFECSICHKKFTQGSSYRRHMNNNHFAKKKTVIINRHLNDSGVKPGFLCPL